MINSRTISNLTREQQLDIIKCKVEVARKAYELSKSYPLEVQEVCKEYLVYAEQVLEKASWGLR